jgi:hypothetical protein
MQDKNSPGLLRCARCGRPARQPTTVPRDGGAKLAHVRGYVHDGRERAPKTPACYRRQTLAKSPDTWRV